MAPVSDQDPVDMKPSSFIFSLLLACGRSFESQCNGMTTMPTRKDSDINTCRESAFAFAVKRIQSGSSVDGEAQALYELLDRSERLTLLDGDTAFWDGMREIRTRYNARPYVLGAIERLGIPGIRFADGPRGCVPGSGTAFPVSMARAATWDSDLETQVGDVMGREIRAQGANLAGSVCINLLRHPAWGRAQETYGADPYHVGEMGAALVTGLQQHVMACVKHYAANSMENARFNVDVQIAEADLHDIYLPHFKRAVDAGAAAIMSAYNKVNGTYVSESSNLMTDILRTYWGWQGVTISDFIYGTRDAAKTLDAGLDIEAPFAQVRARDLKRQLDAGEASWDAVARSGIRSIAAQLRSYAGRNLDQYGVEQMVTPDARALARDVAAGAMVLLKNDAVAGAPLLPLDTKRVRSIALIGRLADTPNTGDNGSSMVRAPYYVTALEGLRAAFPNMKINLVTRDDPDAAAAVAAKSDVAIVVAGYDSRDEGEYMNPRKLTKEEFGDIFPPQHNRLGFLKRLAQAIRQKLRGGAANATSGDRVSLTLRPIDEEIIRRTAAANPHTVVTIVAGSPVMMEAWRNSVPAILVMWYAGMEGGHALAQILSGARNPSGRLPFAIPQSIEHLPYFDRDATRITYDRLHDQRLLDHLGVAAAYPYGFGLSYAQFQIRHANISEVRDDGLTVDVQVANTGTVAGRHVVQIYGRRTDDCDGFTLAGFLGVTLAPGESQVVRIAVSLTPLARWTAAQKRRLLPDLETVELEIGSYARDPEALRLFPASAVSPVSTMAEA